jgi:hypothetical protein
MANGIGGNPMAKKLKARVQRAQRWSLRAVNTGPTPNRQVLSEYQARAQSVADPILEAVFPGMKMKSAGVQDNERHIGKIKRAMPSQNMIEMPGSTWRKTIWLFHTPKWDVCFFVEWNKETDRMRKSLEYGDREMAFKAFHAEAAKAPFGGIAWSKQAVASPIKRE